MPNKAEGVIVDSREPKWVQDLKFGGVPVSVMMLETGDVHVVCSDGALLLIERKTPDDLLNTLRDERLMPQLARLVQKRIDEQSANYPVATWPYLVINGDMTRGPAGQVVTGERGLTNWDWNSVQGALLTVQEMGVMVQTCGEHDFEKTILRLAERKRDELFLLPPRVPNIVGAGATFLASLPGIGVERVMALLTWGGGNVAHILSGLTDLSIEAPVPMSVRRKIRGMLGLQDAQRLESPYFNVNNQEVIALVEKQNV